ncbi:prolyl oligopeptidase family serine peptidase [Sabulilitoribacter arenilitoris]|uniref:Prolyl oligopeptidase family serine peptidase n=1 Tax=Wocania arenilitoris TaxID=2044858 RepID=A0AAE3JN47_9FLAO|nr:prolyl oligopeptidase family serine peptidase [Wocania arenilitoris]MCF7568281.1 prolyl oligopeptidase family serine peptidase [Wocania arenilitoris]
MFNNTPLKLLIFNLLVLISIGNFTVIAQEIKKDSLKTLTPDDYGQWESLSGVSISKNGNWVTYKTVTQDKDYITQIFNTQDKATQAFPNTTAATFSNEGEWVSLTKVPTGKEAKKLSKNKSKDKKKQPTKSLIYNLVSKDTLELEGFQSITFSNTGSYAAMKRNEGNTLIIKNLKSGHEISFGNVKTYSWQENNAVIAMIIDTKDKIGNAIQIYNTKTEVLKVLDQKNAAYVSLKWLEDSDELFAVRKHEDENYENETYHLLLWKNLNSKKPSFYVFDQSQFNNFPINTRVLNSRITVSKNANSIYFTTFSWQKTKSEEEKKSIKKDTLSKEKETPNKKEEAPDVEIWNSKDLVIIPAQKKSKMKGIEQPLNAVWHINENRFVVLGDDLVETIQVQADNKIVIGLDGTPYDFEAMFGRPSYDIYTVNNITGEKNKVLENVTKVWSVSPNNHFFSYLKEDNIHLYDITKKTSTNITKNLDGVFINFDDDHPLPQKSAYGFEVWSKDSKSFFIYSKFNVWQIFTNGTPSRKITHGEKDSIVYRIIKLDRKQKELNVEKPMYFSMYGLYTKKTGYAKGIPGKPIKMLIYDNARISLASSKLEDSGKMLITRQSYKESPNLFLTNTLFRSPVKISNTNAFQKDYAWGRAELIEFENALGKKSQAILYYPANYEKGKKYPMITYVYEKLTNGFHRYKPPSKYDYYNTTVWTQNGYFVLNPDIDFITGEPGTSSTTTLENAVKTVVEMGDVDANKVGLIGHSWGGYQAGFVPTQTDIFAASVAGAGLTELIAMNLAVTPAFGGRPENDHFEVGQERMGSAPWVSPKNYIRNSSVMQIEKLNTPLLFEVGDNDMNVNWSQGIAYYNAARRANKPFVLLVYEKEGHGLRKDKNRHDYQQRILKWFGHYLKGEKAEDWIIEGIPYDEQQRRLKNWKE